VFITKTAKINKVMLLLQHVANVSQACAQN